MAARDARTRQVTRRSHRAGVPNGREEVQEERRSQRLRARSAPGSHVSQEEAAARSAPSRSLPRPRRALRSSSVNARGEEEEEVEEKGAGEAAAAAAASPFRHSLGVEEEKARSIRPLRSSKEPTEVYEGVEARGAQSRRLTRSSARPTGEKEKDARRNVREGEEQLRFSRSGQPERRPDGNTPEDRENARRSAPPRAKSSLGQKDRAEQEVQVREALYPKRSAGGDSNLRKEEKEVRSARSLRSRPKPSGGTNLRSATPGSPGQSAPGNEEGLAAARSRGSRSAQSRASGGEKARQKAEHRWSATFPKRTVSAGVQKVAGGEDEAVPRSGATEAMRSAGAGDGASPGTSHHSEDESVVRPPEPHPNEDVRNHALDALAQCAVSSRSGEVTPPTATHWREMREERRKEDEDLDLIRPLLRIKDQIKQQLLEYKAEAEASKESPPEEFTEEGLLQMIEDLEKKLEGVKINVEMKALALKRVQIADALQKNLKSKDSESQFLLAILKNILTLNNSILKAQQETHDLEEKLLEVRKKRLRLKQAGEEKLLEIQAEDKKKKEKLELFEGSAKLTKMKKNLQREIEATTIIQNVFQNIIIASKIDWASDPALKAIILQLENNLSLV